MSDTDIIFIFILVEKSQWLLSIPLRFGFLTAVSFSPGIKYALIRDFTEVS